MTGSPLAPYLGQTLTTRIDRPLGSRHPRFPHMVYPVNYGFVPGTRAGDGQEIDAYVLGVSEPLENFTGLCIALIERRDDVEDKLVLAPGAIAFTPSDIAAALTFQECFFDSHVIMAAPVPKPLSPPSQSR